MKWLLDTKPDLLPEQLLVLTYNVKAARELRERIEAAVGATTSARLSVSNFHSFCHRVLTESASEANMPPNPDVLDGVGQLLLIREIRPTLDLVYHDSWAFNDFVKFINRAKDELVTPDDFDRFVAHEGELYEDRFGSLADAAVRITTNGNLAPVREVRKAYSRLRKHERAEEAGVESNYDVAEAAKKADLEARRRVKGDGTVMSRWQYTPEQQDEIDRLAASYVADAAALEVMRWAEIASVYRAYQEALVKRGALDFGEQISAVTALFKRRPNILRRWQRQYRYLLVDEFQDANIAQIELIELLGRTPDRPDNVMVVGDDDQSIYRFRGASFAAFAEFDRRFSRPPAHDPNGAPPPRPPRLRIEQNFRSVGRVLDAANRLIGHNQTRFEPGKTLWSDRPTGPAVQMVTCAGPEDEAVAIVDAIRDKFGAEKRWSDVAVLYRKHKHRDAIVARLRDEDIPYTVVGGLSLFAMPEIRDLEQALRAIANPEDDVALTRLMTAGPWRLDALEILHVARIARFDTKQHLYAVIRQIVAERRDPRPGRRGPHRHDSARNPREAPSPPRRPRRAPRPDLAHRPAHDPRALHRDDRPGARPARRRDGGRAPRGGEHRLVPALRGGLAAGASIGPSRWLRRLPRRLPGGRRRAADEHRAVGGRAGRPPHDPLPGEGPRVRPRRRPAAAGGRVAHEGGLERLLPARAAPRADRGRGPPRGGGAAPPLRRHHPRPRDAHAHHPRRPGRHEEHLALRERDPRGRDRRGRADRPRQQLGRPTER